MSHSNLESFLRSTTPRVRFHVTSKTCCRNFNPDWQQLQEKDSMEYFNLGDLWECYDEWSAYGVGAPIKYGNENVVQYYTPYISALQIFMSKDYSSSGAREDCDGDFEDKSWCSESDCEKLSRSSSNNSDKTWDMEDYSNGIEGCNGIEGYSPGRCRLGDLYFEYFESDVPFGRVPLKEKLDALSGKYPGLKTINSVDLSPASWMAVAWYPIYHIPSSRHAKEFYASFLTYHTLSSLFQGLIPHIDGVNVISMSLYHVVKKSLKLSWKWFSRSIHIDSLLDIGQELGILQQHPPSHSYFGMFSSYSPNNIIRFHFRNQSLQPE